MSWPVKPLSDVAEVRLGRQRAPKNHSGDSMRPYLRAANVTWAGLNLDDVKTMNFTDEELEVYRLVPGDIVLSEASGSPGEVGKPALWSGEIADCAFQNTLIRVRAREHEPKFLLHYLRFQALTGRFVEHSRGVGIHHLGRARLASWPTPLPNVAEQLRIVGLLEDHLSRLDAGCSELERAAAELAILRERTVIQALTGGAEADRLDARLTDVGTADGELSALPTGWTWSRLGDIADVVGGVTKDAKKQSDPAYIEVPYLRVANVQRGRLNLDEVTTIRVPQSKAEALRLRPGDVLLNEGGDRDKLARGWVWEGQVPDCIHQNHVFRARITDSRLDPYFLSWTTNTIGGRWAEQNGKQSVNLASISLSMIRRMPVIVPPAGEAARIAKELRDTRSNFDRLEKSIRDGMDRALALRRSLLAAAFSGRLTNSSDEVLEELESV
ncbi:restriction endonuclease subunit S [Mycolicibacterium sp. D5.8-2]|uniref:restriction endonuclease subunit S n=1 Tax=Mycolicibacterium sp. D5.8-2 TaxID=3085903 RepID=UPI00298C1A0B|nr:restriction endonuclease subunit S [Mycolicibacterium sp. D5.8-2]MDW5612409.1 restriction endonuclease subunit S [Mycolicibacterium sp. D5.8-2]